VKVMKVYEGSGGIAPRFLNLGTKLRWAVILRLGRFTSPERDPVCPLDRILCRPQNRCGRFGKEENLLLLLGIEERSLGRTTRNIVTSHTTLSLIRRWEDNIKVDLEVTEYQGLYLSRSEHSSFAVSNKYGDASQAS
jgi:hypothetical protein